MGLTPQSSPVMARSNTIEVAPADEAAFPEVDHAAASAAEIKDGERRRAFDVLQQPLHVPSGASGWAEEAFLGQGQDCLGDQFALSPERRQG